MNSGAAEFSAALLPILHRDSWRSEARVAFARLRLRLKARENPKGESLWRLLLPFRRRKGSKSRQRISPFGISLVKSRATAVRVATLLRRTVLSVALAMCGILARDFLSAPAMNSGANRVQRGSASKPAPRKQAI